MQSVCLKNRARSRCEMRPSVRHLTSDVAPVGSSLSSGLAPSVLIDGGEGRERGVAAAEGAHQTKETCTWAGSRLMGKRVSMVANVRWYLQRSGRAASVRRSSGKSHLVPDVTLFRAELCCAAAHDKAVTHAAGSRGAGRRGGGGHAGP